jgi:hypothetical protein
MDRRLFRDERYCLVLLGLVPGCVDDHILVVIAGTFFLMALMGFNHSGRSILATIMSWNDGLNMLAV